jgi:multiple sugar transport system permease protein
LAPAALYIIVLQLFPLLYEIRLSFTQTSLTRPNDGKWVGLTNFARLFQSEGFRQTLGVTGIYVAACVVGAVGVGLAVALLLDGNYRGRGVARALVTVPWAAPGVAVALIVTWMFNGQYGIATRAMKGLGLIAENGVVMQDKTWALPVILLVTTWQIFPFDAVVLLSALQAVPGELREAVRVDGGSSLWGFRAAVWPSIRSTVGLLALLNAIWAVRRFDLIWITTRGGPSGRTKTLVIDLYDNAFMRGELGSAAAVGVVGIVISLLLIGASRLVTQAAERGDAP